MGDLATDAYSGALAIACPRCGVGQGERCRTRATNRTTDTHTARWDAWWEAGRPASTASGTKRKD